MSAPGVLHRFKVELSDVDRGVYETLDLRVSHHPSEEAERLVTRVLAACLCHEEGLEFGRGLSEKDPALLVAGMGDAVKLWIDVGAPSPERIHRASKHADAVRIVSHKERAALRRLWSTRRIHEAEAISVTLLPPDVVEGFAAALKRKMDLTVSLSDGYLHVGWDGGGVGGDIQTLSLPGLLQPG